MPSIASGTVFAYLDPAVSTFSNELEFLDFSIPEHLEQFHKYSEFRLFRQLSKEFSIDSNGNCDGTLFRFPLRTAESKLSKVLYVEQRLNALIDTFVNEGFLNLLFLKSVQSIKLYKKEMNSYDLKEIYSVQVSEKCIQDNYTNRNEFFETVKRCVEQKHYERLTLDYCLELEETVYGKSKFIKYFISELFGYGVDDTFMEMIKDPDLCYVPLVAVALPINKTVHPIEQTDPGGHIFCGLPLPMREKCMTGLPVHVNGFFALGPDRKDLKWKTISANESNDKSVIWNECLIEKMLPVVYCNLLKCLISKYQVFSTIYQAFPNQVNAKWQLLLPLFYELLSTLPCIHICTKALWVKFEEALFIEEELFTSKEQFLALQSLLQNMDKNVAHVPDYIIRPFIANIERVSKETVQKLLSENLGQYFSLSDKDKLLVLAFVLQCIDDVKKLCGLGIVPLMNNQYGKVNPVDADCDLIYIPTEMHPSEVLPSWEHVINLSFFDRNNVILDLFQRIAQTGE